MPKVAPRYTVTLDRLDGGEAIEDRDVFDVQLRLGMLTILDGAKPIFSGQAWRWLEVRRIDDTADLAVVAQATPRAKREVRAPQGRRSK